MTMKTKLITLLSTLAFSAATAQTTITKSTEIQDGTTASQKAAVSAGGAVKVDNSGVTQPVSGTFWQTTQPVSGTFWQATQPVSGTFWQSVQPASESGTWTMRLQGNAGAIIDFAGQNASAPANAFLIGGEFNTSPTTITNGNASPLQMDANGNLLIKLNVIPHVIVDTAPTTAVTGTFWQATQPVSGTFWQSTQPVSITSMPSTPVTGTFWQSTQPVSGTFWQTTQPVSGTVTIGAGEAEIGGVNLIDTAGVNEAVITASGALLAGGIYNNASPPSPTDGASAAIQLDQAGNLRTFNGVALKTLSAQGTSLNNTQTIYTNSGAPAVLVQLTQTTTLTAGAVTFESSYDGSNWSALPANCVLDPTSATFGQIAIPYTVQASTNKPFLLITGGAQALRIRTSTAITGTGAVTPNYALLNFSPVQTVVALSPTAGNFNVTTTPPTNASSNIAQVAGNATDTNSGNKSNGTIRVVIATDQPQPTSKFLVTPDSVALPANQSVNLSQVGGTNTVNGGAAGSQSVGGTVATNVAITDNPVNTGGQAISSENSAITAGRKAQFVADLTGKQIMLPYANPENFVSGVISTAMTATTSTSLIAAPASGLRNYITQITVSNSHATVSTDVLIQDGSGGTTLYVIPAAAVYGGATLTFPVPLRQPTTATAIFAQDVTTGANVKVSASGYKGI
jgi:hypothetical protein